MISIAKRSLISIDFLVAIIAAVLVWAALYMYGYSFSGPTQSSFIKLLLITITFVILEEIVFRGLIQESIQKILSLKLTQPMFIWQLSYANVFTSLIFSALHLVNQPIIWAAATFVPSLIFGYFKDKYHSLIPAIVLHTIYNTGFLILFSR